MIFKCYFNVNSFSNINTTYIGNLQNSSKYVLSVDPMTAKNSNKVKLSYYIFSNYVNIFIYSVFSFSNRFPSVFVSGQSSVIEVSSPFQ
jgi:hypothetical protein